MENAPIIDVRHNGMGDVVVACWIVHSAAAVGLRVRLNAHDRREVADMLGVPDDCLTSDESPDGAAIPGGGHLEFRLARTDPMSRFDAWCRSVGLPRLAPVRPPYREAREHADWADAQWRTVNADPTQPRVLLFPDAAWPIRAWPKAYFMDLASALMRAGWAVAAMGASQQAVDDMPCPWWGGFGVRHAAAMARRATLVAGNDSGASHLASTLGVRTLAICGPTDPGIVFAHEPNVQAVALEASVLACVGCHFRDTRGYRAACDRGGCQALMRLDPAAVGATVHRALAGRRGHVCRFDSPAGT